MPLFSRRGSDRRKQTDPAAVFSVPTGTQPCGERACGRHEGVQCAYVDRRGRACATAWCPEHWHVVGSRTYCRRHRNTLVALGASALDPLGLPDVDNRGPSLVMWISNQLDGPIRAILERAGLADETLVAQPEVKVVYDRERVGRFERSWKMIHHTGVNLRVTVYVDEENDALVHVRTGSKSVAKGIPPWIDRRLRGEALTAGFEEAERQLFYGFLCEHIAAGIENQRKSV